MEILSISCSGKGRGLAGTKSQKFAYTALSCATGLLMGTRSPNPVS